MGDLFVEHFKIFLKDNLDEYTFSLNVRLPDVMIQYSSKRGSTVDKL